MLLRLSAGDGLTGESERWGIGKRKAERCRWSELDRTSDGDVEIWSDRALEMRIAGEAQRRR